MSCWTCKPAPSPFAPPTPPASSISDSETKKNFTIRLNHFIESSTRIWLAKERKQRKTTKMQRTPPPFLGNFFFVCLFVLVILFGVLFVFWFFFRLCVSVCVCLCVLVLCVCFGKKKASLSEAHRPVAERERVSKFLLRSGRQPSAAVVDEPHVDDDASIPRPSTPKFLNKQMNDSFCLPWNNPNRLPNLT